ncbi:MAG: hypothetical protein WCJ32_00145 [Actinomycetota bacterium]
MIRRLSIALAALAFAGITTTGCSSVSTQRNAVSVVDATGRHELSVKQFETLLTGQAANAEAFGFPTVGPEGVPGSAARKVLLQWITTILMKTALDSKGVSVTDADRKAVETNFSTGPSSEIWKKLAPELQSFVLDSQTLPTAVQATFGDGANTALGQTAASANISIDSRYGMWDKTSGQVVPSR